MSPRVLEVRRCPHCKEALSSPPPRMCPACGGSLQKRYLSIGCLSSAPIFLLTAVAIAIAASSRDARDRRAPASAAPHAAERTPEAVAIEHRRP
ncbi:MAG: hypothetical protein IPJ77_02835 [Planctomycetes bacterium]|nr:hypothetical protein [Planctomycetota bacterium]